MPTADLYSRSTRRSVVAAVGLLSLGAVVACSAPGGSSGVSSGEVVPSAVSTNVGSKPVTLKLYDGQGLKALDDALIAGFQRSTPTSPSRRPTTRMT